MNKKLCHTGIKGMQWGHRRFQNEDGTLTAAGKVRYGRKKTAQNPITDDEKQKIIKSAGLEKAYRKSVTEENTRELRFAKSTTDELGKTVRVFKQASDETIRNGTKKQKLDLSKMSDKEMREKINRQLLENQYNQLFAPEVSTVTKGQRAANDILGIAGSVLAVGSSALAIALSIKELKGK